MSTASAEVTELVDQADRECLLGWRRTMLRGETSASSARVATAPQRPCVDPTLANNPRAYAGVAGKLLE
eukprot:3783631-Pyramimonas_sp.AAC.1